MKLLRRTTIIESKEDGTIQPKPEIKAEPVMQQDFAGALADKESNEEAAKKAVEESENKKNAEELAKELGSHKTPAPKQIKLKPYTESKNVVNREELAKLIKESKSAGRVFKIKRSLDEGFRYVFEDFEKDLPDCYFVAHSDDDANNDNGYFDTEEEAIEFAKANPDTICCVFKVCGNEEEKVWEKTNESCKEGHEEECCPKCHKHPCECEKELHEGELTEAELNEADEKLNLKKYGFVRAPMEDFSDDGNRFTCYYYDPEGTGDQRIRLSKHIGRYGGGKDIFLAARYYAPETGRSKYWNDLNGVSLQTAIDGLPKLKADIDEFLKNIDEFNKVIHLSDEDIKALVEEIKFLQERAGLDAYAARKRAFVNKGIEEEAVAREDLRKLDNALRNARPYDKEKLKEDVKNMIKDVIKAMTSYSQGYGRNPYYHSAQDIESAIRSAKWHISNYPDEIQQKVINHIATKLAELHDFKVEALEEDISGKIIDRIADEIIADLEKDGLVEGLLKTLNEAIEDEIVSKEVVTEPEVVKAEETTIVPEINPDDEIEVDSIETFVPVGEKATSTFTSIKDAGEGAMFAFKDTLKDIYDLTMKVSDLQKLLSDSSDWLLNLLGLKPDEEVEVVSTEELPAPVEETPVIDELEVEPVGALDPSVMNINGFDDPEPIEYDEDDLN